LEFETAGFVSVSLKKVPLYKEYKEQQNEYEPNLIPKKD